MCLFVIRQYDYLDNRLSLKVFISALFTISIWLLFFGPVRLCASFVGPGPDELGLFLGLIIFTAHRVSGGLSPHLDFKFFFVGIISFFLNSRLYENFVSMRLDL